MVHIGILGDYKQKSEAHIATDLCLNIASSRLGVAVHAEWIPTKAIGSTPFDCFNAFIVNTGVYEDRNAILNALRRARELKIPTLATCGGFQHMIIEFARNVLGLHSVGHAEFDCNLNSHIIVPLECSLRGQTGSISVAKGSQVESLYGASESTENFYCSFGINENYLQALQQSPLRIAATDEHRRVRATELSEHPFFIGTLFVPQARALTGTSHPLIEGLIRCASEAS